MPVSRRAFLAASSSLAVVGAFDPARALALAAAAPALAPYLTGEKAWKWKQINRFEPEILVGQLAACSVAYADPAYLEIINRLHGLPKDSLMRLIYPSA